MNSNHLKKTVIKRKHDVSRTYVRMQSFFALSLRINKTNFLFVYTKSETLLKRKHVSRAKMYNRELVFASQSFRNLFEAHGVGMFP